MIARTFAKLAVVAAAVVSGTAMAQQADKQPSSTEPPSVRIDEKGTVHIPELKVPLSPYMSEAARKSFIESVGGPANPAWTTVDTPIETLRKLSEGPALMGVDYARKEFAVDVREQMIGGVPTRVITPKSGVAKNNRNRVLIELHGGGFFTGADGQAQLDAIPVAAVGGYKVVAVKYRQGPEHRFPAATEDVTAVYRALLKQYKAANIGIYGCSTGGSLTAMAVSWFQKEHLPPPGAIGIFSGGAYAGFENLPDSPGAWGGDSRYIAAPLVGEPMWPLDPANVSLPAATEAYLKGVDLTSPYASPAMHPDVLAKFPPTLVLSGTRSFGMSAAIQTHRELEKAGAAAELHLWDGQGHCFYYDFSLPESKEAFATITGFFDQKLGR